jgi:putative addiction module component (TIGR02574 family)
MTTNIDFILELPADQKLEIVQEILNSITEKVDDLVVPEWHVQLLEERMETYKANPQGGKTWAEVKENILKK